MKMGYFDPQERRPEESLARAQDDHPLRSGEISRGHLQECNNFLASLAIVDSSSEHPSAYL
jgi:hypothetical protein